MKLCVLGSGTAIPHPSRGASGYACLAKDGSALLLECGPGSTRRWPSVGLELGSVRTILVTHHHVDHCGDLAAALFGRAVVFDEKPATPLVLAGPVGHARLVRGLGDVYGKGVAEPAAVTIDEIGDGHTRVYGAFRVDARVVVHVEGALGVRVTADGRVLAFSGDSGTCEALVGLCRGADVALLECSYPAARETTKHLSTTTAAEVAREAGVRRLVLTHLYPECDAVDVEAEVRAAGYGGELHVARDGDVIDV